MYSCKGGVGKSTVAVNLACVVWPPWGLRWLTEGGCRFSLSAAGKTVGLLDADIYGPSLPDLISPADPTLRRTERDLVAPVLHDGVRCMSCVGGNARARPPASRPTRPQVRLGEGGARRRPTPHAQPGWPMRRAQAERASLVRGPRASGLVSQLSTGTDWGDLDFLVGPARPRRPMRRGRPCRRWWTSRPERETCT